MTQIEMDATRAQIRKDNALIKLNNKLNKDINK